MDVQLESRTVEQELETGIQHQRYRFAGAGVRFTSGDESVEVEQWWFCIDYGPQGELLAVSLELEGVDSTNLDHLEETIAVPEAGRSPQGAAVVRLHLRPDLVEHVVNPALPGLKDLPDLLQLRDPAGEPVFFDLANYRLTDVIPAEAE